MTATTVLAVQAMHPTLVREPFHRDGWAYSEKLDGGRTLAWLKVK